MEHLLNDYFVVILLAVCFVVGTIASTIRRMHATYAREQSRREIAAYIAEGTITPEQGERLVRADVNSDNRRPPCG